MPWELGRLHNGVEFNESAKGLVSCILTAMLLEGGLLDD